MLLSCHMTTIYSWVRNALKKLSMLCPLTLRGGLAIVLTLISLKFIALPQMDLVTLTLAGPLLGLCIILCLSTVFLGLSCRKRIEQKVNIPTSENYSKQSLTSSIQLKNSNIFPFYNLKIRKNFSPEGAESFDLLIKGKESKQGSRLILDSLRFPHRGIWNLKSLDFELSDIFGFTSFRWEKLLNTAIEVSPQPLSIKPLPVIASSSRAGDEVNLPHDKSGDLFDTKQYDPSDGVRRILWKTYARSGELYVREPEPAVIPEGEVAIFLVAEKEEDHVAAAALSYAKHLISNDIVVLFGTDGGEQHDDFVSKVEKIESMIRACATSKLAGSGESFKSYAAKLEATQRQMTQFLVFASEKKLSETKLAKELEQLSSARNAAISFARVPDSFVFKNMEDYEKRKNQKQPLLVKIKGLMKMFKKGKELKEFQILEDVSLIDVESGEGFVSRV